ncbi:MAG TPA: CUAEP/CCAEP-tail radical SAM protein [Terriglobales bacterium]|nr:CUAEP/CCAEP-tail radical SAM protein [Terriglobales bacterium]
MGRPATLLNDFHAALISTYDLGHQPFGLASPAAWLRENGADVVLLDLSQQALKKHEDVVRRADLIALHLPMHTATRIATHAIPRLRELNPRAHLCAYGLYAPLNSDHLHALGVQTIIGGEFEARLLALAEGLHGDCDPQAGLQISHDKLSFLRPSREGMPELENYSKLVLPNGDQLLAGYTEASRGCKHLCRHCPIVPIYEGKFRVVQRDVVLSDVRQQVEAGAQHITFGDPDFFNGPTHAIELVQALHREFPALTYDATIKVEHLLQHSELLPILRDTGCAFVVSAVESLDDGVLQLLDKRHTRADFLKVVQMFRNLGMALSPTFVAFHPWMSLAGYEEFLGIIAELGLIENVQPIQLAIRLLIPSCSRLLQLPEVQKIIQPFDKVSLSYPWKHSDPRVDALQRELERTIQFSVKLDYDRATIFEYAWHLLQQAKGSEHELLPTLPALAARATIPYLTEPWYC